MLTDPCNCGITPTSHAHVLNSKQKEEVIFWKGILVVMDDLKEKEFYILNSKEIVMLSTRRKGKFKNIKPKIA